MHTEGMATKTVLLRLGQAVVAVIRCPWHLHDGKMAGYRPDVLTNPSYWTDEPIDED